MDWGQAAVIAVGIITVLFGAGGAFGVWMTRRRTASEAGKFDAEAEVALSGEARMWAAGFAKEMERMSKRYDAEVSTLRGRVDDLESENLGFCREIREKDARIAELEAKIALLERRIGILENGS